MEGERNEERVGGKEVAVGSSETAESTEVVVIEN